MKVALSPCAGLDSNPLYLLFLGLNSATSDRVATICKVSSLILTESPYIFEYTVIICFLKLPPRM